MPWTSTRRLDGASTGPVFFLGTETVSRDDRVKCDAPGSGRCYVTSPDKRTSPGAPKGKWEMFCPTCLIENGQQNAITRRLSRDHDADRNGR